MAKVNQVCRIAQAAAEEAQSNLPGVFDPTIIIAIISALLPLLSGIFSGCIPKPTPTPSDVRGFLEERFRNGQYAAGVLNHAIRQARQASRQNGRAVNRADAETIAVATLDQIRLGSDADVQEAMNQIN